MVEFYIPLDFTFLDVKACINAENTKCDCNSRAIESPYFPLSYGYIPLRRPYSLSSNDVGIQRSWPFQKVDSQLSEERAIRPYSQYSFEVVKEIN